jgi:hypothetical protein
MNYLGKNVVQSLTVGRSPQEYTFPDHIGELGDVLTSAADGKLVFSTAVNQDFVDQDVTMAASPKFAAIETDMVRNAAGFRVVDKPAEDITHLHSGADPTTYSGYNIRLGVNSTRVSHGGDNTATYFECKQEEQLFKVAGANKMLVATDGVTLNPYSNEAFTLPEFRGGFNQVLVSDGTGGTYWEAPPSDITHDNVHAIHGLQVGALETGYAFPTRRGLAHQVMTVAPDGETVLFKDQEVADEGVVYPYSFPSTVPPTDGRVYTLASVAGQQGGYNFSTVGVASNEVKLYWSAPSPRGSRNTIVSWYAPQNWTGTADEFAVLLQAGLQGLLGPATGATTISVIFLSGRFRSIISVSGETRDHFFDGNVPLGTLLGFPRVGSYAPEQVVYSVTAAVAREAKDTVEQTLLLGTNQGVGFFGIPVIDLYPGYTFSITCSGDIVTDDPPGGLEFCLVDQYHALSWPALAKHQIPIIRDISSIDSAMALANSISLNAAITANQIAQDIATTARIQMLTDEAAYNNALASNGPDDAGTVSAAAAYLASTTALTAALMVVATTAETLAIVAGATNEPQVNTYEWKMTCTYTAEGRIRVSHKFGYGYAFDNVAMSFSTSDSAILEIVDNIQFNVSAKWSDAKLNNSVNLRSIVMERIM